MAYTGRTRDPGESGNTEPPGKRLPPTSLCKIQARNLFIYYKYNISEISKILVTQGKDQIYFNTNMLKQFKQ